MNAIVPVQQTSGGLTPSSMTEAMRLAEMMAGAKLVPVGLQKSPADCLMVIQQAVRWQLDPFAVAQECSVIQGKLMHSGKLVAAVVNARGNLTQRLSFEYKGAGTDRTITVSGQLQGEPQPRTVEVILKNAATNNKVWQTQPDQQLMYHGVRVWARRHTPELMLGVYSPEEFDETPQAPRRPARPAPNVMRPPDQIGHAQVHDAETGEVHEVAAETPADPAPAASSLPIAVAGAGNLAIEDMGREAAQRGEAVFKAFYKGRNAAEKAKLNAIGDELRSLMPENASA